MLLLTDTALLYSVLIALLLSALLAFIFWRERKRNPEVPVPAPVANNTTTLQLQAYERLVLLADRISLPQLISRVGHDGLSLKDMQLLLIQTIRQEFEHNITQQIYVSKAAWDAVTNFKEQNIMIISKVASLLPPDATGADLNRQLLELLAQNPNMSLHGIVSEALSFEAKKLL